MTISIWQSGHCVGFFPNPVYSQVFTIKHVTSVYIANGIWECVGYVWGIVNNKCKDRGGYVRDKRGQKLQRWGFDPNDRYGPYMLVIDCGKEMKYREGVGCAWGGLDQTAKVVGGEELEIARRRGFRP
jgi:hypothetical protein